VKEGRVTRAEVRSKGTRRGEWGVGWGGRWAGEGTRSSYLQEEERCVVEEVLEVAGYESRLV